MMSTWSWIADVVLSLLLIGTLIMAFRLDRALKVVRGDRAAFEALISNLGAATSSVKLGIQALRDEAQRAAEQIERQSEDADKMATDLSFLIEAANRAGTALEDALRSPVAPDAPPAPVEATAARSTIRKGRAAPRQPGAPAPASKQTRRAAASGDDLHALAGITTRLPSRGPTAGVRSKQTSAPDAPSLERSSAAALMMAG